MSMYRSLLVFIFVHVCCSSRSWASAASQKDTTTPVCEKAASLGTSNNAQRIVQASLPSLLDVTLEQLDNGLAKRLFTSVNLVNAYHARFEEVNDKLNALTEFNPDAWDIAAQLDAERVAGKIRGPLHGIPIVIKNNIATADKMNNTAGSFSLLGAKVPVDSTIAKKLREAGAIILGKANMSQFAGYRSNNASIGWSAYGGQTYGAYYPKQDPCGSSSGSGVVSSIGLAFASIGTETDGSLMCPSSKNNLVGIKPTVGLTSRYLVIPLSEHQDTIGPMARTVKDAAHILQAIAGIDSADNYTSAIPNKGKLPDYVAACRSSSLDGARIGIPRNVISRLGRGPASLQLTDFAKAIPVLKQAGAIIVDPANFTGMERFLKDFRKAEISLAAADFLVNFPAYTSKLTANPQNITDLASLRNFTRNFPKEGYPDRNTAFWDETLDEQGWNNTDPRFWPAYQEYLQYSGEGGLLGALQRGNLDAVILPTEIAPAWAGGMGTPIITVPLGFFPSNTSVSRDSRGDLVTMAPRIPFGLSFLGAKWSEEKLIGYAYAFEQRTNVRMSMKPYLIPKKELEDIVC